MTLEKWLKKNTPKNYWYETTVKCPVPEVQYTLTCTKCWNSYYSSEAFPKRQLCPNCLSKIEVRDES